MEAIRELQKLRADGNIITEEMTQQEIWNLSGAVVRVMSLQWRHDGQPVHYDSNFGVLAKLVPSRRFLAVMSAENETWSDSRLQVVEPDGTIRLEIPRWLTIENTVVRCTFNWFTDAFQAQPNAFGVVVKVHREVGEYDIDYQIDIDAESGTIVRVHEAR